MMLALTPTTLESLTDSRPPPPTPPNRSGALVLGFNIAPSEAVLAKAKACGVEVWTHKVIYGLIDDVRARMEGKLRAVQEKRPMGQAKVGGGGLGGGGGGGVVPLETACQN